MGQLRRVIAASSLLCTESKQLPCRLICSPPTLVIHLILSQSDSYVNFYFLTASSVYRANRGDMPTFSGGRGISISIRAVSRLRPTESHLKLSQALDSHTTAPHCRPHLALVAPAYNANYYESITILLRTTTTSLRRPQKEGYVFTFASLSVCLSVCLFVIR